MSLNNTPVEHGQVLDVTDDCGMDLDPAAPATESPLAAGVVTYLSMVDQFQECISAAIKKLNQNPGMDLDPAPLPADVEKYLSMAREPFSAPIRENSGNISRIQAAVVPVEEFRFVNPEDHLPNPCTSGTSQQIAQGWTNDMNKLQDKLSIKINGVSMDDEPHPSSALSSPERERNSAIADIEAKRRDTCPTNPSRCQELFKRESGQRPLKLIAAIDAKLRERAERQRLGHRDLDLKVCTKERERAETRLRAEVLRRHRAFFKNELQRMQSQQLANLRAALDANKKEDKVEKLCQRLGNVKIALDAKQKSVPAEQQDDDKL